MSTKTTSRFLIVLLFAYCASDSIAQHGNFRLGQVLGLRYFTLTEGDQKAYEQRAKEVMYPFYERHLPGVDWVLLKGDRGDRLGKYAWASNIATLERRNHYWPQEDPPFSPEFDAVTEAWNAEVGEDAFSEFQFEEEFVGDYVLVGPENVKEMPWVDVLGIHHLRVKAGQEEGFERFVTEEWNPNSHAPGTWVLIYKADRGARNGEYALIYAFEPGLVRDAYFPQPGEISAEAQHAFRPLEKPFEQMQTYLDDPTESEYTDFVLVR